MEQLADNVILADTLSSLVYINTNVSTCETIMGGTILLRGKDKKCMESPNIPESLTGYMYMKNMKREPVSAAIALVVIKLLQDFCCFFGPF